MRGEDRRTESFFSYVVWKLASRQIIRCGRSAKWLTLRFLDLSRFDRLNAREGATPVTRHQLLRAHMNSPLRRP